MQETLVLLYLPTAIYLLVRLFISVYTIVVNVEVRDLEWPVTS